MESNNFNRISATGLKSIEIDELTTDKIKINEQGLEYLHKYNILLPTMPEGYYNLQEEMDNIMISNTTQDVELIQLQSGLASAQASITTLGVLAGTANVNALGAIDLANQKNWIIFWNAPFNYNVNSNQVYLNYDTNYFSIDASKNLTFNSNFCTKDISNNIYFTSNKIGIGTSSIGTSYKLDVLGNINCQEIYRNGTPISSTLSGFLPLAGGTLTGGLTGTTLSMTSVSASTFSGSGASITNLNVSNAASGTLTISRGGIGTTTLNNNQILIGNGSSLLQTANLSWNNTGNTLDVTGNINCQEIYRNGTTLASTLSAFLPLSGGTLTGILTGTTLSMTSVSASTFSGSGASITNLNVSNAASGTLSISRGGIGTTTLNNNQLLIGNGSTSILQSSNLSWDISNNTLSATNFIGSGSGITNLNYNNISTNKPNLNLYALQTYVDGSLNTINTILNSKQANLTFSNPFLNTSNTISLKYNSSLFVIDNSGNLSLVTSYLPLTGGSISGTLNVSGDSIFNSKLTVSPNTTDTSLFDRNINLISNDAGIKVYRFNTTGAMASPVVEFMSYVGTSASTNMTYHWDMYLDGSTGNYNIRCRKDGTSYVNLNNITFTKDGGTILNYATKCSSTLNINGLTTITAVDNSFIKFGPNTNGYYLNVGSTNNLSTTMYDSVSCGVWSSFTGSLHLNPSTNSNFLYLNYYNTSALCAIGQITPLAKLHVASGTYTNVSQYMRYFNASIGLTYAIQGFTDICAIFESSIWCKNMVTSSSDSRIKKNIQDINDDGALQKILLIKPKTYNYIDIVERGDNTVYGFIAQQIQEIIPEAVSIKEEVIPNIYKLCDCSNNIITIPNNELIKDDKIDIIDISGNRKQYNINNVSNDDITIDENLEGDKCFVFGSKVKDFHTLNKDYIFTLNVCASQELYKLIEKQQNIINDLIARITKLENQNV